ncbi:peptidase M15 [Haloferula helveola]|uniref:Peptidase M15 n=1 Tax=Haloferula helveola TaxID=490095 RepID=A0ABN6GYM4_9BACT|nr:peptidase M15 [Haloferula helveola]
MPEAKILTDVPQELNLNRRKVIGTIGVGGLALVASSTPASAFFFKKKEKVDLSGLPATWVRMQGKNLEDYADYLAGLRLDRLTPRQVIDAHAKRRGSVWNSLPPKQYWRNMGPTLKAVDRVASHLGQPVKEIVSAYRSPAYNARCAGASRGSWHQANVAVDVKFPVRASSVASMARSLRSKGHFRGGVGRYYSFTHIDTRGQNVDW